MAYRGGGGGPRGGRGDQQQYGGGGGGRGVPVGGRGGVDGRFVWPPPRPAAPASYTPAVAVYHNPNPTGPHQEHGVVVRGPAPTPAAYPLSSPTPTTVRGPSPSTAGPFQPARVSSPPPTPAPTTPAAFAKKLFVTETALAPPAAAAQVGQPELDLAPVSKKGLAHPARPGAGTIGKKVMMRANHFLFNVADNNLFHYDVSINPKSKSRAVNREVIGELIKFYGATSLGGKLPAYDGRKSLYTAGALPLESKEFAITLVDPEKKDKERAEREYKITIRIAGRADLFHLQQFLGGRQRDMPQETIQVLDVVLRESPSWKFPVDGDYHPLPAAQRSLYAARIEHLGLQLGVRTRLCRRRQHAVAKGKPTGQHTFSTKEQLEAGTSADRPRTFSKKKPEVYERREESIEEESDEEVEEKTKHKGTAGLIEIDNPNLVKPKSIKAKDVDVDRTTDLSRRERVQASEMRTTSLASTARATATAVVMLLAALASVSLASDSTMVESGCNTTALAHAIVRNCFQEVLPLTSACCLSVLPTVDIVGCLCEVVDKPQIADSGRTSLDLFDIYIDCGGRRRAQDKPYQQCDDYDGSFESPPTHSTSFTTPPPPPRPGKSAPPSEQHISDTEGLEIGSISGIWLLVGLVIGGGLYAIHLWRKKEAAARQGNAQGSNTQGNHVDGTLPPQGGNMNSGNPSRRPAVPSQQVDPARSSPPPALTADLVPLNFARENEAEDVSPDRSLTVTTGTGEDATAGVRK